MATTNPAEPHAARGAVRSADARQRVASRVGEIDWQILVEAFDNSQITVIKRWSKDNAADHSTDAVTVNLLCDGELAQTVELSAKNNWTYTFEKRVGESAIRPDYAEHEWTVEEAPVPEGYTAHYTVTDDGSTVYIDNVGTGGDTPITYSDITVKKGLERQRAQSRARAMCSSGPMMNTASCRSASCSATGTAGRTCSRMPSNWSIKEYNIPYGYTPYYSRVGNVITITNSTSLIQTGQLNWPVAVLGGLGVLLIALGLITSAKRKSLARIKTRRGHAIRTKKTYSRRNSPAAVMLFHRRWMPPRRRDWRAQRGDEGRENAAGRA